MRSILMPIITLAFILSGCASTNSEVKSDKPDGNVSSNILLEKEIKPYKLEKKEFSEIWLDLGKNITGKDPDPDCNWENLGECRMSFTNRYGVVVIRTWERLYKNEYYNLITSQGTLDPVDQIMLHTAITDHNWDIVFYSKHALKTKSFHGLSVTDSFMIANQFRRLSEGKRHITSQFISKEILLKYKKAILLKYPKVKFKFQFSKVESVHCSNPKGICRQYELLN